MYSTTCIFCNRKIVGSSTEICNDCLEMGTILAGLLEDSHKILAVEDSPEQRTPVKLLRELSFVAAADSFLNVYKRLIELLLRHFSGNSEGEIEFSEITKGVRTQLNYFNILAQFAEAGIIIFKEQDSTSPPVPNMKAGEVLKNLVKEIVNKPERENAELRYAHILSMYSILPLLIRFSRCKDKSEIKQISPIPRRPWMLLLQILVKRDGNRLNIENVRKSLSSSRISPATYSSLLTHLSSTSTEHVQKLIVKSEGSGDEREFIMDPEMISYVERLRTITRKRE